MEEGTETNRYFARFDILPGRAYDKRAWASVESARKALVARTKCRSEKKMVVLLSELVRQDRRQARWSFEARATIYFRCSTSNAIQQFVKGFSNPQRVSKL